MNIEFLCRHCDEASRTTLPADASVVTCAHCGEQVLIPPGAIDGGGLHRCLVCPSTDLFVRKDFPQRLGVGIVTLGIAGSCVAWGYHELILTFVILFVTA